MGPEDVLGDESDESEYGADDHGGPGGGGSTAFPVEASNDDRAGAANVDGSGDGGEHEEVVVEGEEHADTPGEARDA